MKAKYRRGELPDDFVGVSFRQTPQPTARRVRAIAFPVDVNVPAGWVLHVRVDARPPDWRKKKTQEETTHVERQLQPKPIVIEVPTDVKCIACPKPACWKCYGLGGDAMYYCKVCARKNDYAIDGGYELSTGKHYDDGTMLGIVVIKRIAQETPRCPTPTRTIPSSSTKAKARGRPKIAAKR